jgi:nucleoside-triphosphatase THEP1
MELPLAQKKVSEAWLRASVIGSLWASVEIILGSFFHNIRIPFAGTILAMNSVALMIAFSQVWKIKGLFWRAGLIAALMKSISPSAILLGPMVGIFTEALLMEFSTRLLGRNILGFVIGGALALSSTIVHKIVSLLVYYGFDFVTVLVNLYDYAVKQIGYPGLQPETALLFLVGIYILLGVASSVFGFSIGQKAAKTPKINQQSGTIKLNLDKKLFGLDEGQKFSVKVLFLHLFVIAVCLVMINNYSFFLGAAFIIFYVVFCIFYYKRSLRHLKRPFFWIQVVVLTMLATIFFNGFQSGNFFDQEGLIVGVKMNIRAILILVGFSAISVELRNPVVKSVLYRKGFSQLYLSVGLAFAALPSVIGQFAKPKLFFRKPFNTLSSVLLQADNLFTLFRESLNKPKVFILTGEKHKGKTTFAAALAEALKKQGIVTGGFLAPGKFENNRRSEFDILNLKTGSRKPLCSIHRTEGDSIGPFKFDLSGQQFGNQILSPENLGKTDVVFIDEIGPLEIKNQGWAPAINKLMDNPERTHIWIIRKGLVDEAIQKWGLMDVQVFNIDNVKGEVVLNAVMQSEDWKRNMKIS